MRINNNMSAVITNNQLLGTESSLADIMEKLSSGFSINHASDNPSGIAIAGKMQAQIDGLNKASDNGNDGISVLQTAEGALQEVTDMIQRMRELSVQAANGTNAQGERESIQLEIESLKEEINRISKTTQFNTLSLLDGSLDNRTYAENCSRILTSDSVQAGIYSLTIEKAAVPAAFQSMLYEVDDGAGGKEPISFVDRIDATGGLTTDGIISINGETISLSKGMSGEEVYEYIRQVAEIGGAEISDPTKNYLEITTLKFGADANLVVAFSSEAFAEALGFTANELGNDTTIKNTTSLTFSSFIDNQKYDVVTKKDVIDPKTGEKHVEERYETKKGLSEGGTVKINGLGPITLTQGMSGHEIYLELVKLQEESAKDDDPATGEDTLGNTFTLPDSEDEILQIGDVYSIEYSSRSFASALGLEYRGATTVQASKVGTNAEVKLDKAKSQFGAQSTVSTDGNKITVTDTNGFEISFLADAGYQQKIDAATDLPIEGTGVINFNVTNIGTLTLQIGANEGQTMDVKIGSVGIDYLYLDDLDVTIANGPEDAMNKLDYALEYVTNLRSQIGAYENRLEHTTKSLDETSENMTSAISEIEDADMATTMVEYTRLNVLEQAGTSALAQANELPQLALQLLQ